MIALMLLLLAAAMLHPAVIFSGLVSGLVLPWPFGMMFAGAIAAAVLLLMAPEMLEMSYVLIGAYISGTVWSVLGLAVRMLIIKLEAAK